MKLVFLFAFLIGATATAGSVSYGFRDCRSASEELRVKLLKKEICVLKVNCLRSAVNEPSKGLRINTTAYCPPNEKNECLDAQACLDDQTLNEKQILEAKLKAQSFKCSDDEGILREDPRTGI
jgi:hypothetical protein